MKKWLKAQRWEATDTGWLLTLVIFMTVQWAAFQPANKANLYSNKFEEFVHLKPSEMGDTLAGAFSALAFVWIIVTVFMQACELREQRAVFLLQKDEMEEQRKATQEMANAMREQATVFKDEQRERSEDRAERLFLEICNDVFEYARRVGNIRWFTDRPNSIESMINLEVEFDQVMNWEAKFSTIIMRYHQIERLRWRCEDGEIEPDMPLTDSVIKLRESLVLLLGIRHELSEVMQFRLQRLDIDWLLEAVRLLEGENCFWRLPLELEAT